MGYNLSGPPVALGEDVYSSSTTAKHALGTPGETPDGNKYRYVLAGAAPLVVGNVIQAPAELANHQNLVPAAAAIGDTTITVTLGATAATADQYADGTATVTVTPGLGQIFRISGNPAADSAATLTLTLKDSVRVALTTTSRIDLAPNPYRSVIQCPATTLTGAPVGVCTTIPIPAAEYGWIQTKGVGGVLGTGTPGVGLVVGVPAGTAGGSTINPANVAGFVEIGSCVTTGGNGEVNPVLINLP